MAANKAVRIHKAVREPKPEVLCIQCYDARIGPSQEEFLESEFGAGKSNGKVKIVSLPGGVAFTTPGTKKFEIALAILDFTLKHFNSIKRVVPLSHDDCGWYKANCESGQELSDLMAFKIAARKAIKQLNLQRKVKVTAFFSFFTSPKQKKAAFKKV